MTVYVIQKGNYSDRHIIGVVETEEEAQTICNTLKRMSTWDADSIYYEAYDTKRFQTHRMRFLVDRDLEWFVEYDDYNLYANYKESSPIYYGYYVVYADSPEQAVKIAQDLDAEETAKREGVY